PTMTSRISPKFIWFPRKDSLPSGIILDSDGYTVTNADVLKGAKRVRVSLDGGLQEIIEPGVSSATDMPYDARIVRVFSEGDVALLKIDATGLPILPFPDADAIQQGQLVFAGGNPDGLNNSISM